MGNEQRIKKIHIRGYGPVEVCNSIERIERVSSRDFLLIRGGNVVGQVNWKHVIFIQFFEEEE